MSTRNQSADGSSMLVETARLNPGDGAAVASEQPNEALASLLAELGWSPRALARRINRAFGAGTVADTAPYHWRDAGRVPRPPLPTLTAA